MFRIHIMGGCPNLKTAFWKVFVQYFTTKKERKNVALKIRFLETRILNVFKYRLVEIFGRPRFSKVSEGTNRRREILGRHLLNLM